MQFKREQVTCDLTTGSLEWGEQWVTGGGNPVVWSHVDPQRLLSPHNADIDWEALLTTWRPDATRSCLFTVQPLNAVAIELLYAVAIELLYAVAIELLYVWP